MRCMKITALAFALAALAPLAAYAHATTTTVSVATAPIGTVGPAASELASFVLSAVALLVAGLALSRTRK